MNTPNLIKEYTKVATHIGIGFSRETNTTHAGREAALQAKTHTKQQTVDCAIVFSTIHYNPLELTHVIKQILNHSKVIGCSTAGIILSESIEMRGVAVLAISSSDIEFGIGSANDIAPENIRLAGTELARSAVMDFGQHQRQVLIFFYDSLLKDCSLLVKGVQEVLGKVFPIVGAGSSDDFRFQKNFQYFQDKPSSDSAVALLLGGQVRIGLGTRHGWKPLGKPRIVEKAEGCIIKTIDGKKASNLYEDYLGLGLKELRTEEMKRRLILYPLGFYVEGEHEYLLRFPFDLFDDGSIACQGEIPEGRETHLMISTKDLCQDAALQATQEARDALVGRQPQLVMVFESLGRYKLLGREAIREIQRIREALSPTVPLIGMYSCSEIAPSKSTVRIGEAHLHNQTITILAIT